MFSENPTKMTFKIHELVTGEVTKRFGVYPMKIGKSRLEIDLWDEKHKTSYEIILGDGAEIWKDILKAMLLGASKLTVFCRNYPDTAMKGYMEIANTLANLENYLKQKLEVQVVLIRAS